jgi:parallel beta-helix repeat protein
MKRKWLAIGIILLFVGTCIIPAIAQNTETYQPASRGTWLYVGGDGPGNYTRIQDAIDNASQGDTVFVYAYSAPYYETVMIAKSINVIGENKKTTVIDGRDRVVAVALTADEITFTGFTVQNANLFLSHGIYVCGNDNIIIDNIFSHNSISDIYLAHSNNTTIRENTFTYSMIGVYLYESNNTIITNNNITKNYKYGIALVNSKRNNISMNNIMDNTHHNAFFTRDLGTYPLSNHWDANYWGRPYFLPKRIHSLRIFVYYSPVPSIEFRLASSTNTV